ncbi:MAG: hypothetical protein ACE5O2_04320 [Armatimonadota bacterium]
MVRSAHVWAALLFASPLAAPAVASQAKLAAFMPADDAVKGFKAIKGTDQYCATANDLHLIYDGGDGEYKKAGVTEALQRSYKAGKVIATVTIHKMGGDWKKAKAFYTKKHKGIAGKPGFVRLAVKNAGAYGPAPGNTLVGYSWTKYYFVSYTITDQASKSAAEAFVKVITQKIAK